MSGLDLRLNAFRPDLADARLRGRVDAAAFADGHDARVSAPIASVRRTPHGDAMQTTQALMGETVRVFDDQDGWAWVQLADDGYVGYLQSVHISAPLQPATHRVAVPSTFIFPKPDLKSQPATPVTLNARIAVTGSAGGFSQTGDGGFIFTGHLNRADEVQSDFAAVATKFLHVPYYWGGKSVIGLDCSGLVQVSLQACGFACPRDSDMQQNLGQPLPVDDLDSLRRGDLVFWKGHVGIMTDPHTLLHANGHHMMVVAEPLRDAAVRIAATGSVITHIRRLQ